MEMAKVCTVIYNAVKFNKCDTQYQSSNSIPESCFLTDRVKIEKYQGYSKAYNLGEYFRMRGATSWKSGEQVTGLWKTGRANVYRGDRRTKEGKTIILFEFNNDRTRLTVYVFPENYYPSTSKISSLVNSL